MFSIFPFVRSKVSFVDLIHFVCFEQIGETQLHRKKYEALYLLIDKDTVRSSWLKFVINRVKTNITTRLSSQTLHTIWCIYCLLQHRMRLRKYKRDARFNSKRGRELRAIWSPDTKLIALTCSHSLSRKAAVTYLEFLLPLRLLFIRFSHVNALKKERSVTMLTDMILMQRSLG